MTKLTLKLEDLAVMSFEAEIACGPRRGTVRGHDGPVEGGFQPNLPQTVVPYTAPVWCMENTEPDWCYENTEPDLCQEETEPDWCRWPTEQIGCHTSLC